MIVAPDRVALCEFDPDCRSCGTDEGVGRDSYRKAQKAAVKASVHSSQVKREGAD